MHHIIDSSTFTPQFISKIFSTADRLQTHPAPASLRGKILASLFYEPSTRTRFSFESAMLRMGGSVIGTESAGEFSSARKGETLEDSIRVMGNYADAIVLRHFERGAAERAAKVSSVPVINAGDGAGQHPTQALIDLYAIKRELGRIDGFSIALAGDLKHGRTVRSLAHLLAGREDVRIFLVSPKVLRAEADVRAFLADRGARFEEVERLDDVLPDVDVLYQTRVQKERFATARQYRDCMRRAGSYQLTPERAQSMKPGSVILHPLPRVDEISPEVDAPPGAAYFRQASYGPLVRGAVLKWVMG